MLASLGLAFLIMALNVKYRDFRYLILFIVQFGLYVSSVIDGFRWCVLGGEARLYTPGFVLGLGVVALFLWFGIAYFRRTEHSFRRPDMI